MAGSTGSEVRGRAPLGLSRRVALRVAVGGLGAVVAVGAADGEAAKRRRHRGQANGKQAERKGKKNPSPDCGNLVPGANLRYCDLSGQNLAGENLQRVDLTGADLSGADLTGADLSSSVLLKATFADADLADANLFGTIASKADFAGADLSDVNFDSSVVRRTNFLGATTTLHTTFFSAVFCRTVWTNGTKLNYHC